MVFVVYLQHHLHDVRLPRAESVYIEPHVGTARRRRPIYRHRLLLLSFWFNTPSVNGSACFIHMQV